MSLKVFKCLPILLKFILDILADFMGVVSMWLCRRVCASVAHFPVSRMVPCLADAPHLELIKEDGFPQENA